MKGWGVLFVLSVIFLPAFSKPGTYTDSWGSPLTFPFGEKASNRGIYLAIRSQKLVATPQRITSFPESDRAPEVIYSNSDRGNGIQENPLFVNKPKTKNPTILLNRLLSSPKVSLEQSSAATHYLKLQRRPRGPAVQPPPEGASDLQYGNQRRYPREGKFQDRRNTERSSVEYGGATNYNPMSSTLPILSQNFNSISSPRYRVQNIPELQPENQYGDGSRIPENKLKETIDLVASFAQAQVSGKNVAPSRFGGSTQFSIVKSQEFIPLPEMPEAILQDPLKNIQNPQYSEISRETRGPDVAYQNPQSHSEYSTQQYSTQQYVQAPEAQQNYGTPQGQLPNIGNQQMQVLLQTYQPPQNGLGNQQSQLQQQDYGTSQLPSYASPLPVQQQQSYGSQIEPPSYNAPGNQQPQFQQQDYINQEAPAYNAPSPVQQQQNYGSRIQPLSYNKPGNQEPQNQQDYITPQAPSYNPPPPVQQQQDYGNQIPQPPPQSAYTYEAPPRPSPAEYRPPLQSYSQPLPQQNYGSPASDQPEDYQAPEQNYGPPKPHGYPQSPPATGGYGSQVPVSPKPTSSYGSQSVANVYGSVNINVEKSREQAERLKKRFENFAKGLIERINRKRERLGNLGGQFKSVAGRVAGRIDRKLGRLSRLGSTVKQLAQRLATRIKRKRERLGNLGDIIERAIKAIVLPINLKLTKLGAIANILQTLAGGLVRVADLKRDRIEKLAEFIKNLPSPQGGKVTGGYGSPATSAPYGAPPVRWQ